MLQWILKYLQLPTLFFGPDTVMYLSTRDENTHVAEFANNIDLDEVAHNEPPHQDLHFCPLVFGF